MHMMMTSNLLRPLTIKLSTGYNMDMGDIEIPNSAHVRDIPKGGDICTGLQAFEDKTIHRMLNSHKGVAAV